MITLRPYQRAAVDAIYVYFSQHDGNPLLVLPTGSGKSVIQAQFQREVLAQWPDQRILLLTHVKELIEQNAEKLATLWPEAPMGIYAASMNRREGFMPIVFASIQSVHKRAQQLGRFDLIIIDECHLVPMRQNTMYRRFLDDIREINPAVKIIGMSATPYRLDSGYLHTGKDAIFTDIAYDLPLTTLIDQGYLAPLVTKGATRKIDLTGVRTQAGEFKAGDVEKAVHEGDLTQRAVEEICAYGHDRAAWLIFCPSVAYAYEVRDALQTRGVTAEALHGGTPKRERADLVAGFRSRKIRALTNCDVLTTGFDAPAVDLIAFLRPTQSVSLYVQMSGRGMRLSPETGKRDCLVLDFAGNVERHGPVDAVRVTDKTGGKRASQLAPAAKECPDCHEIVSVFTHVCPNCDYEWPRKAAHEQTATEAAILSTQIKPEWMPVQKVFYRRHRKIGKPDSLRVDYVCGVRKFSEWVCVEHDGFAKRKADRWMTFRLGRAVDSVDEARRLETQIKQPTAILVKANGRYDEIIDYRFDEAQGAEDPRTRQSDKAGSAAELYGLRAI